MAIDRGAPIHGTGWTIGDIVDAAAGGGGGGYVPVPGSPTKFVRVTQTDDNVIAGASEVFLPLHDFTDEASASIVSFQVRIACAATPDVDFMVCYQLGAVVFNGGVSFGGGFGNHFYSGATVADANAFIATDTSLIGKVLSIGYTGMSTGEAMQITVELQITPIAPTPRPTAATGL